MVEKCALPTTAKVTVGKRMRRNVRLWFALSHTIKMGICTEVVSDSSAVFVHIKYFLL